MRDGDATRRRILDAATAEFARYGIAGARVDRIARAARANKAQLYEYFGNKDQLFDTAFRASLEWILDAAPIDASDLPDYAVRLYDEYLRRPDLIRLATWSRLERRPEGHLVEDAHRMDAGKLAAVARAQEAGEISLTGQPFDVFAMVIAMSMAWSPVSNVYAATAAESPEEHDRRRALLAEAVRRAFLR